MNLEYNYDKKIFDKAVVTTDKILKIRDNTENLESILEEENLVEYIFVELDNKRAESKNEFEELQVEKIILIYKVIGLIFTILAIPVVGIYIEAIFKTLILSLLYLSGTFGMIEVIDKIKDIRKVRKNCTVCEAQINLLLEKLNISKQRLEKLSLEEKKLVNDKVINKEISKENIESLEQKMGMYKYLIENDNEYKNYLNYKPLGNEYDHVFFTDKDIFNIKDAKKKVKKR